MQHRPVLEASSWVEICRRRRLWQHLSQDFGNCRDTVSEAARLAVEARKVCIWPLVPILLSSTKRWIHHWIQWVSCLCAALWCSSECWSHGRGISRCYRWIYYPAIPDHTTEGVYHKGALLQVVNPFGLTIYKNAKLVQFVFHELKDKVSVVILSFFTHWAFSHHLRSVVL